ncbi:tail fiber assembly protein [Citrobacter sp. RHBSTW-00881]|uniref:tail fiber assembly protein n=1 Tax=Citrobacter sp. RHBSTW-00881 TaxID=2742667 RepID=UPI002E0FA11D
MSNFALIKDGTVENIFVCEDDTIAQSLFPDETVICINNPEVGIGWFYANGQFSAPPQQEKSHNELVAEAEAEKRARIDAATSRIVVWQTKLLMGRKLTDDEFASLNAWMDYIDALTAIDISTAPDIEWLTPPGEQAS